VKVRLLGGLLGLVIALFVASPTGCVQADSTASSRIYWGAWIEGTETYSHLYGGSWGNAPWDSRTWKTYEQHVGKNPSIIHWGVPEFWNEGFSRWVEPLRLVRNAGALSLIDMDTGSVSLRSIASGAEDSSIRAWARKARAYGHPFFLRFDWEMNGNWFPWGTTPSSANTPADYVAAWRHVHNIFSAQGARNVTWVWCPNVQDQSRARYARLYPGAGYVDWTCLDGYNKHFRSKSFSDIYGTAYRYLVKVAPTKPIILGEIGSLEYRPGVKADWISNMLSVLPTSFPRIKAIAWFNWRIDAKDWEIESSASSQHAFANGIASPYYATASSFSMPPRLSPIRPLP
jgi:hypothetical protein